MGLSLNFAVNQETYTHEVVQYNNIEAGAIISIGYGSSSISIPNPIGVKPNSKVWISLKSSQNHFVEPKIFKLFEPVCRSGLKLDILKGNSWSFVFQCYLISCFIPAPTVGTIKLQAQISLFRIQPSKWLRCRNDTSICVIQFSAASLKSEFF